MAGNNVSVNDKQYIVETVQFDRQTSFTLACSPQMKLLPANGGIRWRQYSSRQHQEAEAVMLAQRMSLKHGLYNTGFSGGKIVVNSPLMPSQQPEVIAAIGELLNRYNGTMYTGCDINTSNADMDNLRQHTSWILNAMDSPQVDTSIATGFGVWSSIRKIIALRLQHEAPVVIAIHGMGKVGAEVARQCMAYGCTVVGYDINPDAKYPHGVTRVNEQQLFAMPSHILCIASLSGILNAENVSQINTQWVVSSANSPFNSLNAEKLLTARDIHYLPDYVSNAGAVICDSVEMAFTERYNQMSQDQVNAYVHSVIGAKTEELLNRSQLLNCDVSSLLHPLSSVLTAA
ncbi:Glu/Leu/Phe/Val dehydrogenase [Candidatus Pantoea multigeneris]|uniref:Glu/Leu/Phe/Val dehydrogenase n=1 Tax=Candidatus Pantoea multigeneris TaxID=2608357 RepID=A0ABX0R8A0_9GAMM|nr:Glu/Leu/Phe/Val dehydrogenase [Pantoea multigeneris]NIF21590.1 Glu/Leu/Phe/Val dehydrogenase [Pantoea multigeneris]